MKYVSLVAVLIWLSAAQYAHAALINCTSISSSSNDYKIVLDDFAFASEAAKTNPDLAALKDRVRFNFNGQLEVIKSAARKLDATLQVPLKVVNCAGRQPSLSGEEFTDELAERLTDQRVVVEMWGTLYLKTPAGSAAIPHAMIGYTIPPVQHYSRDDSVSSIHLLEYPKISQTHSQINSTDDLENMPELPAFALIGLATKAARANRYDLAVWAFNRAESGLLDAQVVGESDRLDPLLAYLRRSACLTRSAAKSDVDYKGSLKLLPQQSCEEAP